MEQVYSPIFGLQNWGSERLRDWPQSPTALWLVDHGQVTPEPWLRGSGPFTKKTKPQETFRQHKSHKTQRQNYEPHKIGLRNCPFLKRLQKYSGGSCVAGGLDVSSPTCCHCPLCAHAPSSCIPRSCLTSILCCLNLIPQHVFFSSVGSDGWAGIGMLLNQALHTFPRSENSTFWVI